MCEVKSAVLQLLLSEFVKPSRLGASTYRASSGFGVIQDESQKKRKKKKACFVNLLTSYSAVPIFVYVQ